MRPVVFDWCKANGLIPVCEVNVKSHMADMIAVDYHPRIGKKVPTVRELVGIELKLSDVKGVLHQCSNLKSWCHRVYAVMPRTKCLKLKPDSLTEFTKLGIGLLMHDETKLEELLAPMPLTPTIYKDWYEYFQKNLWRRIRAGKAYFTPEQTAAFAQSQRKYKELVRAKASEHKAMLDMFLANQKENPVIVPDEPKPLTASETLNQYNTLCDKHETLMGDLDKLWDSLTPAEQNRAGK